MRCQAKYDMKANPTATAAGNASRAIRRGRKSVAARSATTTSARARRPDAGPGPASSASMRTQSAPGTVSMPASFASWEKGRIRISASVAAAPVAATTRGRGRPDASHTTSPTSHSGTR